MTSTSELELVISPAPLFLKFVGLLQNHTARIITFSNCDTNANDLFKLLKWNTHDHQCKVSKSVLKNETPNYLRAKFDKEDTLPHTEHYKRSFSYSGVVLRNSLPSNLKQAISLNNFKYKINCQFPSVKRFSCGVLLKKKLFSIFNL